jgi:hypothetical protein
VESFQSADSTRSTKPVSFGNQSFATGGKASNEEDLAVVTNRKISLFSSPLE